MSLLIDGFELIFIILIDDILNCFDISWLELLLLALSDRGSYNWHLFRGSFSILWSRLLASGTISWWNFDLSDWIASLASATTSHTSFLGMSICFLTCCWLCTGKLTILLRLNYALIEKFPIDVLLMLLNLSFSFSVIWRDQLFFISILEIWIIGTISFLLVDFRLEVILIIFLLQCWSEFRLIIFLCIILWFSVCWSSYFWRWHSHCALGVFWSVFWWFALFQARFCSWLWTPFLLIHTTSGTLLHNSVVLVSICVVLLLLIHRVWVLIVTLVSLICLVILHIFYFYLIYNF